MAKARKKTASTSSKTSTSSSRSRPKAPAKSAKKTASKPVVKRRADLGASADPYYAAVAADLSPIAAELRRVVRAALPSATEVIKWGMPWYGMSEGICYLKAWKGYVTLGFSGDISKLEDPDNKLQGDSDHMRHIKVRSVDEINGPEITKWLKLLAR